MMDLRGVELRERDGGCRTAGDGEAVAMGDVLGMILLL